VNGLLIVLLSLTIQLPLALMLAIMVDVICQAGRFFGLYFLCPM